MELVKIKENIQPTPSGIILAAVGDPRLWSFSDRFLLPSVTVLSWRLEGRRHARLGQTEVPLVFKVVVVQLRLVFRWGRLSD